MIAFLEQRSRKNGRLFCQLTAIAVCCGFTALYSAKSRYLPNIAGTRRKVI